MLNGAPGVADKHFSYAGDRIVSDRTIDTRVKNLRRKLSQAIVREEYIHSICSVGYKIE